MKVAIVVLAAGASRRLGQPKQLLEYRGAPLLETTIVTARNAGFDQVIVSIGGAAAEVQAQVDLSGTEIALNPDFAEGCTTSIRTALGHVAGDVGGIVLMLGDQPGVSVETVRTLVREASGHSVGVCVYDDGLGHPLWFARSMFDQLKDLHGDKAVWKIIDAGHTVGMRAVEVNGPIPRDVDTWDDYRAIVDADASIERSRAHANE